MPQAVFLEDSIRRFLFGKGDGKKLLVIKGLTSEKLFLNIGPRISEFIDSDTSILLFRSRRPVLHSGLNDKVIVSEQYLTAEDHAGIDDHVFNHVSLRWDRDLLKAYPDMFTYKGVELARAAEYDLQLYLLQVLKMTLTISRVIQRNNIGQVMLVGENREIISGLGSFVGNVIKKRCKVFILSRPIQFSKIRENIMCFIADVLDASIRLCWRGSKSCILADARLARDLALTDREGIFPGLFEDGLRARFNLIFAYGRYVSYTSRRSVFDLFSPAQKTTADSKIIKELEDVFVYDNLKYFQAVHGHIRYIMNVVFQRIRRNVDTFHSVSDRKGPVQRIVLRNDLKETERTVVASARCMNIKTLVVQHGILAEHNGHNRIYADHVALWGKRAWDWYRNFGNDENKMTVTGNPRFHNILKKDTAEHMPEEIVFQDKRKHLVSLFTTGVTALSQSSYINDDLTRNLIEDCIEAVNQIGDINLYIKLHPNESPRMFKDMIEGELSAIIKMDNKYPSWRLIGSSEVVVTMDSTIGLEAVMWHKPLVVVNTIGRADLLPYVNDKVASGAYRKEDVKRAIIEALGQDSKAGNLRDRQDRFINYFVDIKKSETAEALRHFILGRKG